MEVSDMEVSDDDEDYMEDSQSEFEYKDGDRDGDDSDGEDRGDVMVIEPPVARRKDYILMNRADLEAQQMRCIQEAAELLMLSHEDCFVLLREHSWDATRLQEAWFENETKVRERCGLSSSSGGGAEASSSSSALGITEGISGDCIICMCPCDDMTAMVCGHRCCQDCWRGYLHSQVDDGKASIQAKCPGHPCKLVVPAQIFERFCDGARQVKYKEWYLRAYVDDNPGIKWCPNPNGCPGPWACEYQGGESHEIQCECSFLWCWSCGEESHRPACCKTVQQWNIKNSAESENISWIRANTKKCPKCHKPIEKNQGCNHIICSKAGGCGHEFCWLCLGEWNSHGTATGGYYQCNIYDKQTKDGKYQQEEHSRQKEKDALNKYMFFFERFMEHDKSMQLAVKEHAEVEGKVKVLHDAHGFEVIELQFLYDALQQVRACRRVLKWSYVYGYYLKDTGPEKNLFEHLQKNLEEKTDNLHEMLEKDLEQFLKDPDPLVDSNAQKEKFMDFRSHVTNFTNVTTKFLKQIVDGLGLGGGLTGTGDDPDDPTAASAAAASNGLVPPPPPKPVAGTLGNRRIKARR